ncbi:MAG: hypothetical protein VYE64_06100 [Planctomycetota bacterium]|nr:hypothetical protein [Planctomycetota bacterium]
MSYAAAIREKLEQEPLIEKGRRGQLDFLVDDRIVLSRKGGLWAMLTKKPWPTTDDVLQAILTAQGTSE